jgi:hypothetical protein
MSRFFAAALVGLTIVAALSTSASAFQCFARSTNGAVGSGSGIFLERAQAFAMRRCMRHGGGLMGGVCHIDFCR